MGFLCSRHTPLDRHGETWVTPLGAVSSRGLGDHTRTSLSLLPVGPECHTHNDEVLPRPRPEVPRPHCQTGPGHKRRCTPRSLPRVPNRDLRNPDTGPFSQKVKFISPSSEIPSTGHRQKSGLRSRRNDTTLIPKKVFPRENLHPREVLRGWQGLFRPRESWS